MSTCEGFWSIKLCGTSTGRFKFGLYDQFWGLYVNFEVLWGLQNGINDNRINPFLN